MINHAKSLTDENLFHLLLKCLLGRTVAVATGQCKKMLSQIVTELILPDLWKVTRLQGNYEAPEVHCCVVVMLLFFPFTPIGT